MDMEWRNREYNSSILRARRSKDTQVVDVPDEIAREVPVAIANNRADKEVDISAIRGTLTGKLGPWLALEDIISVDDIEMDDFPKTSSGKTQKNILRENFV